MVYITVNLQIIIKIVKTGSVFPAKIAFFSTIFFLINTIARLLVSVIVDSAVIPNQRGYLNLQLCSRLVRIEI